MAAHKLDIFGDLHGQGGAFFRLAARLGYPKDPQTPHPDGRRMVLVGDLIDRGPDSLAIAEWVKARHSSGLALCLLGNHELNLIEWRRGRMPIKPSNRSTVRAIEADPDRWHPILDFFETLPMALEWPELRVCHAAWNPDLLAQLRPALASPPPGQLPDPDWAPWIRLYSPYAHGQLREGLSDAPYVDAEAGPQTENAVQVWVKGHERPAIRSFQDSDGVTRDRIRAMWWSDDKRARQAEASKSAPGGPRHIFGHYWNLPPQAGEHAQFVPPSPSGHPDLRRWFESSPSSIPVCGEHPVPASERFVCVDYNGMTKTQTGRVAVGAYRHPEAVVCWEG